MTREPRRNRVDPWGDFHAIDALGMFTGNRGCLVAEDGTTVRHHNGSLWIICRTRFRDWRHPLEAPRTWTPLFFLDDAVALAAGHRPCGLCRREDYFDYRHGVTTAAAAKQPILANELNRRLASERLRRTQGLKRGRGLERAEDRLTWEHSIGDLPVGAVALIKDDLLPNLIPHLVTGEHLQPFSFAGWGAPLARPSTEIVRVLTPPTSLAALRNGFAPTLHPTALTNQNRNTRANTRTAEASGEQNR